METLEAQTSNPMIKMNYEQDELILELFMVQPKIHKRATANIKRRQLDYILNATAQVFECQPEIQTKS